MYDNNQNNNNNLIMKIKAQPKQLKSIPSAGWGHLNKIETSPKQIQQKEGPKIAR